MWCHHFDIRFGVSNLTFVFLQKTFFCHSMKPILDTCLLIWNSKFHPFIMEILQYCMFGHHFRLVAYMYKHWWKVTWEWMREKRVLWWLNTLNEILVGLDEHCVWSPVRCVLTDAFTALIQLLKRLFLSGFYARIERCFSRFRWVLWREATDKDRCP